MVMEKPGLGLGSAVQRIQSVRFLEISLKRLHSYNEGGIEKTGNKKV